MEHSSVTLRWTGLWDSTGYGGGREGEGKQESSEERGEETRGERGEQRGKEWIEGGEWRKAARWRWVGGDGGICLLCTLCVYPCGGERRCQVMIRSPLSLRSVAKGRGQVGSLTFDPAAAWSQFMKASSPTCVPACLCSRTCPKKKPAR